MIVTEGDDIPVTDIQFKTKTCTHCYGRKEVQSKPYKYITESGKEIYAQELHYDLVPVFRDGKYIGVGLRFNPKFFGLLEHKMVACPRCLGRGKENYFDLPFAELFET